MDEFELQPAPTTRVNRIFKHRVLPVDYVPSQQVNEGLVIRLFLGPTESLYVQDNYLVLLADEYTIEGELVIEDGGAVIIL